MILASTILFYFFDFGYMLLDVQWSVSGKAALKNPKSLNNPPRPIPSPNDTAYVLFTSGSTGKKEILFFKQKIKKYSLQVNIKNCINCLFGKQLSLCDGLLQYLGLLKSHCQCEVLHQLGLSFLSAEDGPGCCPATWDSGAGSRCRRAGAAKPGRPIWA